MVGGMDAITPEQLDRKRRKAQRLCDHHRLALRAMPLDDTEAHLAWLGRVEVTRMEYLDALDAYTKAYRATVPA